MQQISFYLKKFESIGLRESSIKKTIIDSVASVTGISLLTEDIVVKNGKITIQKIGPEKSEIFIHRKEIEELIKKHISTSASIQ